MSNMSITQSSMLLLTLDLWPLTPDSLPLTFDPWLLIFDLWPLTLTLDPWPLPLTSEFWPLTYAFRPWPSFGDPSMHWHSIYVSHTPGIPGMFPMGWNHNWLQLHHSRPAPWHARWLPRSLQACMPLWDWVFPQPKKRKIIGCCSGKSPTCPGCGIPSILTMPSDTF